MSSQKFIARNRAPRVQIEYDVELYGAEKKVQLPFVMGVMSDLAGKSEVPQPSIADRKFLEIDVDNFDERMKSMAPRAAFTVPNTLTGEGNLAVDLTFTKMDDFSPAAIAANVDSLKPLLEARTQLSNLMTYMDGKAGAEALIEEILGKPELLQSLSGGITAAAATESTLNALRDAAPEDAPAENVAADVLAGIERVEDTPEVDTTADVLAGIEQIEDAPEADTTADVLAGIEQVDEAPEEDTTADVLAGIEQVEDAPEEDSTADVLASIEQVEEAVEEDTTADVLAGIEQVEETTEEDITADVLASIEEVADLPDEDTTADVLAAIELVEDEVENENTADVLAGIEQIEETPEEDTTADVLASIEQVADLPDEETTADVLSGIEQVEDAPEKDSSADVLAGIEHVEETAEESDDLDDILSGLDAPEEENGSADEVGDVLAGLEAVTTEAEAEDDLDDILSGLDSPEATEEEDDVSDVLAGLETVTPQEQEDDNLEDILSGLDTPEEAKDDTDDVGDVLAGLEAATPEPEEADDLDDILSGLDTPEEAEVASDDIGEVLAGLETTEPEDTSSEDDLDDILGTLETSDAKPEAEDDDLDALLAGLDTVEADEEKSDETDDILAGLETADAEIASADEDVDALLAGLEAPEEEEAGAADDLDDILAGLDEDNSDTEDGADDDLDAVLAGLDETSESDADADDDLDDILAGLDVDDSDTGDSADDDLDAVLAGLDETSDDDAEADDDLDALLAGLDGDAGDDDTGGDDDLDALLAGLDDDTEETSDDGDDDMDALLAGLDDDSDSEGDDDLDALLAGLGEDTDDDSTEAESADDTEAPAEPAEPIQSPFGMISQPRPSRADLNRTKFRMAVFGDFTGRAARGLMETGDALANRKAIPLDVDTIDEIIEGFGTTLVLPIGADGAGVEVKLGEMDDLHPDELYDNVELFEAISGVRRQLGVGSMADRAVDQLKSWSETYSTPIKLPKTSAGASMPANLKLSDFQALIGDTRGALTQATPADEMIARIIGPHVVKAPDAGAAAMQAAVDEALSSAMNLILHHPEFQAIESQWRSLDLLARRIETDVKLEIVLYDVSAEELAADLAAQEDLSESGLFKLVTDVLDPEEGAGGFSALFGMYTFEETPPHAELLARIGQVGLHVDAPFFSAISPSYLDTAPEDRHPLVAKTWDTLRQMPEAAYVALAAPRFLLRQPYGAKSDPVYAFEYEEFTPQEGLKGMLWANPVVLIAILLAGTYKKDGKAAMDLGSMMTLGDLPFYYVNDRYGDQVALPCTERNLTTDPAQATLARGYMPVLWMKGRNDIRLGSFRSLGGDTIAGPWQEAVPKPRKSPKAADLDIEVAAPAESDDDADDDTSLDDLLSGLEDDASDDDDDMSLDDLLAGFDDDDDASDDDDDEMDPELAALLEGL